MNELRFKFKNEICENFIRSVFDCEKGAINITNREFIGKIIYNNISVSEFPKKTEGIQINFPHYNLFSATRKFPFFSAEDHVRINNEIESEIKRQFVAYMQIGKDAGFKNKEITYAFIDIFNLPESSFDMLIKFDFRRRQKIRNQLLKTLKESINQ